MGNKQSNRTKQNPIFDSSIEIPNSLWNLQVIEPIVLSYLVKDPITNLFKQVPEVQSIEYSTILRRRSSSLQKLASIKSDSVETRCSASSTQIKPSQKVLALRSSGKREPQSKYRRFMVL